MVGSGCAVCGVAGDCGVGVGTAGVAGVWGAGAVCWAVEGIAPAQSRAIRENFAAWRRQGNATAWGVLCDNMPQV
jgi:hypothetical protein